MVGEPRQVRAVTGLYVRTSGGNLCRATKPTKLQHRRMQRRVFMRDDFRCQVCAYRPSDEAIAAFLAGAWVSWLLQLDHIHPYRDGGRFEEDNLQTLCQPCNLRKGAKH